MWRGALRKQYLCRYHPEENPKVWKLREANIRCPVEGPGGLKLCQACIHIHRMPAYMHMPQALPGMHMNAYVHISHACIYAHALSSARRPALTALLCTDIYISRACVYAHAHVHLACTYVYIYTMTGGLRLPHLYVYIYTTTGGLRLPHLRVSVAVPAQHELHRRHGLLAA